MANCQSCGLSLAGPGVCPRCGAAQTNRLTLTWARWVVLGLTLLGLGLLVYAQRGGAPPGLTVAELTQRQNLAYVGLHGRVIQAPQYNIDNGSLYFRLADDTGDLGVSVGRTVVQDLQAAGQLPALGDDVWLAGTVRLRDETPSLTLNTAAALTRTSPAPLTLALGALNGDLEGQAVQLKGRVIFLQQPVPGLTVLTLQDPTGQVEVVFDESARALTGDLPTLQVDDVVQVAGIVTQYRGQPQVVLRAARDVTLLPLETVLETALTEPETSVPIGEVRVGVVARIRGTVTAVESLAFGFLFTVQDVTGQLRVLVRSETYPAIAGGEGLRPGAVLETFGMVTRYNNLPQLTPDRAVALTVLQPGPVPTNVVPLGALSLAQVGQRLTVTGTLTNPVKFSQGQRFQVTQDGAALTVVLWSNLQDLLPDTVSLKAGTLLTITGQLNVYQGELELMPQLPVDVEVVK